MCRMWDRYLLCRTIMSLLRPLAIVWIKYLARAFQQVSQINGLGQLFWGGRDTSPRTLQDRYSGATSSTLAGAPGRPEKAALDLYSGGEIPARAHVSCQTDIQEQRAARWQGPQGVPKKRPWISIQRARYQPAPA